MKISLDKFLKQIKLTTKGSSSWNEEGYKEIRFRPGDLAMNHKKKGDFAWISPSEIEIEIPDNLLINKPLTATNEQPKFTKNESEYIKLCMRCLLITWTKKRKYKVEESIKKKLG